MTLLDISVLLEIAAKSLREYSTIEDYKAISDRLASIIDDLDSELSREFNKTYKG